MTTELLAGALETFRNTVHELVGTRSGTITTDDGHKRAVGDSLYQLMKDSITGVIRESEGSSEKRSTPPLWLDCSSWLEETDRTVRSWGFSGEGPSEHATVNRLFAMADAGWRPDDVAVLNEATRIITKWITKAENLLDGERRFDLVAACPSCGETSVRRRDSAGEWVRQPALQVGAQGCVCIACEHYWGPERFLHLAAVLGCNDIGVLE
ncbi:hypothetical protein QNA24_29900 [Rhodococcus qingshengii]|uniref:DUF7341 domain-containing protein n=1 Tax=Rhodococcus TaxID=1827 RepID=UPI001E4F02C5|nr:MULTISPECIES: hypothetical protein [Rhodococcus]MCD2099585.1 hypothetical protein [Rhodococcus rhodochrous]MCD2123953.1 hypothetical protein [Rhodococcus rhodochrous]MCQ4136618.1 hypothetical protein [Rhodococcus rhodochrous]MDJ0490597.1 hypothetical protein [Rhodococcus qingshengii]